MRLNHLLESQTDAFVEKIKTECSLILDAYKTHFMFNGQNSTGVFLCHQSSFNSERTATLVTGKRAPRDTPAIIQDMADEYLNGLGNDPALRGNSLFARAYLVDLNANFGSMKYILFPVDGAKYTYASTIDDFYADIAEPAVDSIIMTGIDKSIHVAVQQMDDNQKAKLEQIIWQRMHKARYRTDFNTEDILSVSRRPEILIHGKIHMVNSNSPLLRQVFS